MNDETTMAELEAAFELANVVERMLETCDACPSCQHDRIRPRPVRASDHSTGCDLYNALQKAREP